MLILKNGYLHYLVQKVEKDDGFIAAFKLQDPHTNAEFTLTVPEQHRAKQRDWKNWLKDLGYNLAKTESKNDQTA
jgi:hypothetical protein